MKFKALSTLIIWHEGEMKVFNNGDKGDLPENVIQQYIDGKQAVALKGKAAKEDTIPEPEGDGDQDQGDAGDGDPIVPNPDAPPV